jgi:hypothetical protein
VLSRFPKQIYSTTSVHSRTIELAIDGHTSEQTGSNIRHRIAGAGSNSAWRPIGKSLTTVPLVQYWSELTISAPRVVLIARQVHTLIEFLTKRTESSAKATFTPPLWRLRAP